MSHERAGPDGQAQIVPNPPTEYFSRVCLNSKFLQRTSFLFFLLIYLSSQKTTWLPSVETRPTASQFGKTPHLTHQTAKQFRSFFISCSVSYFHYLVWIINFPFPKVTASSREGCMDLCLEETAFICRAAVYKTRSGSCSLTR